MNNVKTIRESRGIQQKELADALGVTQGAISQWETGLTDPTMENFRKMTKIFSCKFEDLIGGNDDGTGAERA